MLLQVRIFRLREFFSRAGLKAAHNMNLVSARDVRLGDVWTGCVVGSDATNFKQCMPEGHRLLDALTRASGGPNVLRSVFLVVAEGGHVGRIKSLRRAPQDFSVHTLVRVFVPRHMPGARLL